MPEARRRSHRALLGVLVLLLAVLAGAGGYWALAREYAAPGPASATVRVTVVRGEALRAVLAQLAALGAVRHPREVELYVRLRRLQPRIEVGVYDIPAYASPAQIMRMFAAGRVVLDRFTVVEGATFAEFLRELDAQPDIVPTLRGASDAAVMSALGHPGQNPQGRFFPDTYQFSPGTLDLTVLRIAYDKMSQTLAQVWAGRSPGLPFDTPYEALILASVIEKETGVPGERTRIAGVFVNRLRRGMRLQSDPTVIYGLGARYDGTIHTRDLTTDTPYNTYTRTGLPPTPICLPGLASLHAAVHPANTDDLYFVATGTGGHHFSATLAGHDLELRRYLRQLRVNRATARHKKEAHP